MNHADSPNNESACPPDSNHKSTIASIRREQIIEAAVHVIVSQGIEKLSLSRIEDVVKMKRGQLTYYFPRKEDILLAVFDRFLLLMFERFQQSDGRPDPMQEDMWTTMHKLFRVILGPKRLGGEFESLQYTFLAQIAHRQDYRERLASLYEQWRGDMAEHWQRSAKPALALATTISPRVIASLVQALIHGLAVQLTADAQAFDRDEMLRLCLALLAPLFISSPVDSFLSLPTDGSDRAREDSRE